MYIVSKCAKRLSDFKVKGIHGERCRKLLLPLSFGAASLSLLHILHGHIRKQREKTSRQGYEISVIHIDESLPCADSSSPVPIEDLKQDYPLHHYHVYRLNDTSLWEQEGEDTQGLLRRLSVAAGQSDPAINLQSYLSSLASTSSVEDISAILRTQLVVNRARALGCEAILWGDSTTRLAEKTLAETAKGRGFSLPWLVNDSSPHGVPFMYPLRDILRKELTVFACVTQPSLAKYIIGIDPEMKQTKSSRKSTIDGLMTQYFESVEQNYPSIVSNVVRTGSKLSSGEYCQTQCRCRVCDLPVDQANEDIEITRDGSGESPAQTDEYLQALCYGCLRSTQGSTSEVLKGAW